MSRADGLRFGSPAWLRLVAQEASGPWRPALGGPLSACRAWASRRGARPGAYTVGRKTTPSASFVTDLPPFFFG